MNIFEYLGLNKDHRKSDKVTQFVKHYDEVSDKYKGKEFAGQVKMDGVCALTAIQDGVVKIFSRTGKLFTNTALISNSISSLRLPNGVYMGELCCSFVSLEVLSGVVNPNRVNPLSHENSKIPAYLDMYFFDMISIKDFVYGKSDKPYSLRHEELDMALNIMSYTIGGNYIKVLPITPLTDSYKVQNFTDLHVDAGEEGVVFRDPSAGWEAGHKGWRVMKKVKGVDYDLFCVGLEEGTGKYLGKVANLIFSWKDGKQIKCMLGKGWTHAMAEDMWNRRMDLDTPIGKIFQVYALEESSKGKLRLPKVGECRFDKEEPDV